CTPIIIKEVNSTTFDFIVDFPNGGISPPYPGGGGVSVVLQSGTWEGKSETYGTLNTPYITATSYRYQTAIGSGTNVTCNTLTAATLAGGALTQVRSEIARGWIGGAGNAFMHVGTLSAGNWGHCYAWEIYGANNFTAVDSQILLGRVRFNTSNGSSYQAGQGADGGNFYGACIVEGNFGEVYLRQVSTIVYELIVKWGGMPGCPSYACTGIPVGKWTHANTNLGTGALTGTWIKATPVVFAAGKIQDMIDASTGAAIHTSHDLSAANASIGGNLTATGTISASGMASGSGLETQVAALMTAAIPYHCAAKVAANGTITKLGYGSGGCYVNNHVTNSGEYEIVFSTEHDDDDYVYSASSAEYTTLVGAADKYGLTVWIRDASSNQKDAVFCFSAQKTASL
ncbi:MAG: hypothetical protein GY701_31435, partial [Sulfitobacter sp.]|nr:hypothetical protein [Sulfitobacter sp.]